MAIAIAEIAQKLAMALATGIAKKFGADIMERLFPSGTPSYFTEVYKEIAEIVKDEIEQNTVDEINGEINGLKNWIINVYVPRKASRASKRELFDMIKDGEYDMAVKMVSILQESAYAELALGVFVIGAGIHLTLLQELAFVDPDTKKPKHSSYAVSVQKYAEDYADFADSTYDSIEKKRTDESVITTVRISSSSIPSVPGVRMPIFYTSVWKDKFTGEKFEDGTTYSPLQGRWSDGTDEDLEERSNLARSNHIEQVKKDTAEALYNPKEVADLWRKLVDQPIPPKALSS